MPKVTFKKRYQHKLDDQRRVDYRKGQSYDVDQKVADAAAKAGAIDGAKVEKAKAD